LFATHYHELNELQEKYDRIHNYHIEIIETANRIIFSHKLKKGGTDLSFGIHVAKMAGLPSDVTERANEILRTFEVDGEQTQIIGDKKIKPDIKNIKSKTISNDNQLAIFTFEDDKLRSKIKSINIEDITPLKAFELLSELVSEVR
jgi:DNA mismatch repair protein MutS